MDRKDWIGNPGIDIPEEAFIQHYGVSVTDGAPGVGSGRYPLGSGTDAYQHCRNFRTTVKELRAKGWDDNKIMRHLQMNSSEYRANISNSKNVVLAYERAMAKKLKDKGMSTTAIAIRMFKDPKKESTVRNLLKDANARQQLIFENTKQALIDELNKSPYLDVGKGSELYLGDGVTKDKLDKVLKSLEKDGYRVYNDIKVQQYGSDDPDAYTTVRVLTKNDISKKDVYDNLEKVHPPTVYSEDGGESYRKIEPPVSIDGKRIYIRYAEEGGITKDGTIEIRPGVEDLSLGGAHYAQVRIGVNGTHYLKGMALYSDNIPEGYDVVFNTNKHEGTPMEKVLKPMKVAPEEGNSASKVFGASIKDEGQLILARQRHYIGKDGEEHLSAINIVNEEGSYKKWSDTIAAQMLSKQPPALAKRQLDLTYEAKKEQLNDILALTNPTVKKKLLEQFADGCDSDAVHMQAYGFPGQNWKVILPVDEVPDNQIYCPDLPTGTRVALIRYPHASIHEIPDLIVNNNIPAAKKILGNDPIDGVGINAKVAQHLSGADFDGDTVLVIPNNDGAIKSKKQYDQLKDLDLESKYPKYEGMKVMKENHKQTQMGVITNLIADMTILGATDEEMVRVIEHSMVIIDSVKHELDWRRSEKENRIQELKDKYQLREDGKHGAGTLITRAKSPVRAYEQKSYYKIDPETGKKIAVPYDEHTKLTKKYRMVTVDDARELISSINSPIERVYAQYANNMKALALEARKAAVATPLLQKDKEAASIYADEVTSLNKKLQEAKKNKPLERQAQILANVAVKQYLYDNPDIANAPGELKKLKGRTLQEKRAITGANKKKVTFTENEWKAVQAGAVSDSFLKQLLANADDKHVKELSMPRERTVLSSGRKTQVQSYLKNGYTIDQVAKMLDVPVNQVKQVSIDMR